MDANAGDTKTHTEPQANMRVADVQINTPLKTKYANGTETRGTRTSRPEKYRTREKIDQPH